MGVAFAYESGLLSEEEREPVLRSHYPTLEALDLEATRELARWLRARRGRARDALHDRRRAKLGKGQARGAVNEPGNKRGVSDKKQVFARALKRVNAHLDALAAAEKRRRNTERLRAALARVQAQAPSHPGAGDTAHAGARARGRGRRPAIVQGGRIGSVTKAGARAQAARDARG